MKLKLKMKLREESDIINRMHFFKYIFQYRIVSKSAEICQSQLSIEEGFCLNFIYGHRLYP